MTPAPHGISYLVAGLNLETGQLSRHYIAEILLNVTLINYKQPTMHIFNAFGLGILSYCLSSLLLNYSWKPRK